MKPLYSRTTAMFLPHRFFIYFFHDSLPVSLYQNPNAFLSGVRGSPLTAQKHPTNEWLLASTSSKSIPASLPMHFRVAKAPQKPSWFNLIAGSLSSSHAHSCPLLHCAAVLSLSHYTPNHFSVLTWQKNILFFSPTGSVSYCMKQSFSEQSQVWKLA